MVEPDVRPRLLDYLPAIFQRSAQIGAYLAAFDAVLFGLEGTETGEAPEAATDAFLLGPGSAEIPDSVLAGLEQAETAALAEARWLARQDSLHELIERIPAIFDPDEADPDFLPWLSQWAALSLHEGIPESRYRLLIGKMITLYSMRGTRTYVEQVLALYTGANAVVEEEDLPGMKLGFRATVGLDTRLGQDPFQFRVSLDLSRVYGARERLSELLDFVKVIVNLSKPAHTHFRLTHNLPAEGKGLVIFVRSTLGVDTLLWK